MDNNTNTIRLQVGLYLLFICSLLVGTLGLTGYLWPELAIPESLMVTLNGTVALALGGLAMLSLLMHWPLVRRISGILLAVIGAYLLALQLASDMLVAPALCALLLGMVALLGLESRAHRLFGLLVAGTGVLVGGYVISAYLSAGKALAGDQQIIGFTRMGAAFCVGFGVALAALCRPVFAAAQPVDRSAAVAGALAVAGTFFLLVTASWGVHQERHSSARSLVQHYVAMLDHELHSNA